MRRSAWSTVYFERRKKNLEFAPARTVGVLRLTRSCHLHFELRDFLSGSVVRIIATVIAVEHFHDHQKKASTSWLVSRAFYIGTWLCCYLFDNFSTTERKITMFCIWLTVFARTLLDLSPVTHLHPYIASLSLLTQTPSGDTRSLHNRAAR